MKANKIRKLYLDFFKSKQHKIVSSGPLVLQNDPTLMFANAGMNQFKDIFLGDSSAKNLRIVNSQKCLRVSGKHNDLEEVGHDTYHHTMFEMLGSWSFGDYFKEEAIDWAWEFLVDICHLEIDRIYVTVFQGQSEDNLVKDNEAFNFWKKYLPEHKILNGNKKDNFWEMGETGPCGPCSEIHFDNRPNEVRKKISGASLVNTDHPQVIEIWNLVFMQYNQFSDGNLKKLPNYHVDTGMGLERLTMIMQGVGSNYDTDIFQPIIKAIAIKAGVCYGDNEQQDIAMRVISDHIRAISFSIADGLIPSNVKAGYVIRRILRRAVRYAYTFLNLKDAFMYELVSVLSNQMSEHFSELKLQEDLIRKVVKEEEESFLRTLADGLKRIEHITKRPTRVISGRKVFELYDTYGFPVDLTALILSEQDIIFNQAEFNLAMSEQKDRSMQAAKLIKGDWKVLIDDDEKGFLGYNNLEKEIKITRYREVVCQGVKQYQLVFNITPFYPEGGGQSGDTGIISNTSESIIISDSKKENKLIVHLVDKLPNNVNSGFLAKVDAFKRIASSRNHTATHLLHQSLRNILGAHVTQKGSLVNPTHLRFDFTHFSKIKNSDLQKIETDVNIKILANIALNERTNLPLSKAEELGAIMLFSEKYDDIVRVIEFADSIELCGGTHVSATGEIGLFKILSEGSTSAGIRRIEAVTGMTALSYLNKKEFLLNELCLTVKNVDLKSAVEQLLVNNKQLERQLAALKNTNLSNLKQDLLKSSIDIGGVKFISKIVEMEAEDMKNISFQLRSEKALAVVLGSKVGDKALLSVMLTDDLVDKGMDAVLIIREIAKEIDGGGGGQAFYANAGGKKFTGLSNALNRAIEMI